MRGRDFEERALADSHLSTQAQAAAVAGTHLIKQVKNRGLLW
jgi:hypothetical protein